MRYIRPFLYDQNREPAFQADLKAQIAKHFEARGGNQKATPLMWFKVVLYIGLFFSNWYALAFEAHSLLVTIGLLLSFAAMTILVAFNVSHDAVHFALSKKRWLDEAIFYFTFNFLGPNAYLWKIRHTNAHHFFVNIPGSDMDIESTRILRIAPHIEWHPIHRFQHLYCCLFYSVFTLNWIFMKDFKIYFMKSFGGVTDLKHSPWRMLELIVWKCIYVGFMIGVPAHFLPYSLSTVIYAFLGFHLVLSTALLILFAASHIAEESHYVIQEESGYIPHSFLEHQLLTSVDYHPRNPFFGFVYGGFNAHVAHHMFPNTCSIHYPALSHLIKNTAEKHQMPYFEKSFIGIIISHFKMMKTLGQSPESGEAFIVSKQKPAELRPSAESI